MGMTTEKVAVVTGAGSGLGRLITITLADQGWFVVAAGRRFELLEDTVGLALPEMVLPVQADVADEDSVAALFATVRDRFGRLDLLVNNAGTGAPAGAVDELSPEGWQSIVGVNLTGSFLCAHHAVELMKAQRPMGGRIINNGSISAHAPRPRSVGYTVTKHAITGLTKSISLDGRPFNIACGQIDIGNANTAMTERIAAGAPAGGRIGHGRADVRSEARGGRGGVHGRPAARRERPVPDHHRDHDAVHRPRLMAGRGRRRAKQAPPRGPRAGTLGSGPSDGGASEGPFGETLLSKRHHRRERYTPEIKLF